MFVDIYVFSVENRKEVLDGLSWGSMFLCSQYVVNCSFTTKHFVSPWLFSWHVELNVACAFCMFSDVMTYSVHIGDKLLLLLVALYVVGNRYV